MLRLTCCGGCPGRRPRHQEADTGTRRIHQGLERLALELREAKPVGLREEVVEAHVDPTPEAEVTTRCVRGRAISEEERKPRGVRHRRPPKRVRVAHERIDSIGELKADITEEIAVEDEMKVCLDGAERAAGADAVIPVDPLPAAGVKLENIRRTAEFGFDTAAIV